MNNHYTVKSYEIAGVVLNIEMAENDHLWSLMTDYAPFEVRVEKEPYIVIRVVDSIIYPQQKTIFEKEGTLYKSLPEKVSCTSTGYYIETGLIGKEEKTLKLETTYDFKYTNVVCTVGPTYRPIEKQLETRWFAFARALNIIFTLRLPSVHGLCVHSSAIISHGKAILFHAPSGTGKSTHSLQWMKAFPDAELLNDDFPVVRVWPDGRVIAYGSPWSGKTPCYKNLSAPVAAFVRINRAKENKIHRLRPVEAYASLMPSCTSKAKWNPEITEAQHQTLGKIISSVPCYQLDCLPNEDAARVCAAEVLKNL